MLVVRSSHPHEVTCMTEIILNNILSPAVLFFVLGLIAVFVKSDLKFPAALSETLSIYLLIAIGLKGGIELAHYAWDDLMRPIGGTLLLSVIIPLVTFGICRGVRIDRINAAALAATYGSVSIVTYGAALAVLEHMNISYETFMNAMVVILESPAIFISVLLLRYLDTQGKSDSPPPLSPKKELPSGMPSFQSRKAQQFLHIIKESLVGKSILLMVGALVIGYVVPEVAATKIKPLFIDMYPSVLILFLLGMGLTAGERLSEVRPLGMRVVLLATFFPLLFGSIGVFIGSWSGLSIGGMALMGVLGASASYIAAPAAIRTSIPQANPAMYLGMSLGITFPFNLIIGLPLFVQLAQWLGA